MIYNKYPKGSEWRKWDLHVHTPASYSSQYANNWDNYVKELIKAIRKHEISVIATADYFTIDGYSELMKYYDNETNTLSYGNESANVYLIPGVELRLDIFNSGNESVNYHVLFDPEKCSIDFIKENFLKKLKVSYRGGEIELTERNLIALGYSINEKQELNLLGDYSNIEKSDKEKYLRSAYSTITLTQTDIKKASKAISDIFDDQNIKKKACLKIIAGKGHGSLKSLKWFDDQKQLSRIGLTRENLTNLTDLIFSNDPDDIGFYLGKNTKSDTTEIQQRFGNLKACVWGSDSHSIGKLLHPSNGDTLLYTWIKADPTFEGLKQVVFEPEDRVVIQEEKPQEKTDYLVIDKVRFNLNNPQKLFTNDLIEINSNMNVVIGGKSSGKSLLLYHIAKTVDPVQVEEKMKIVGEKGYEFDKIYSDFDFEVYWNDGYINSLRENQDNKVRQITYIPQMYINHLAEEKGEKKLKNLIENILNQNEEYKDFVDKNDTEIQDTQLLISSNISTIYMLLDNINKVNSELKDIGDKNAIQFNIEKIKEQIDDLRKKAGFTDEEDIKYGKLVGKREYHHAKLYRYQKHRNELETFTIFYEKLKHATINSILENSPAYLDESDYAAQKMIEGSTQKDINGLSDKFDQIIRGYIEFIKTIEHKIDKHKIILEKLEEEFQPYLTKITNQHLLKKLLEDLEVEYQKIKLIEQKEKQKSEIVEQGKKSKKELSENYVKLFDLYKKILDRLQNPELSKIGYNLELQASLNFDTNLFTNGFCNLLDGRSNFKSIFGDCFNDKNEFIYISENHIDWIQKIFDKIWLYEKNGIKFKAGVEPVDACKKLFDDYFIFKYNIKQNEDDILQMSPGKRGLVLLQLILHLSNANHPILIDQPEDNLDNRTIYNELNQFIKDKKIQRQILIVTHNANLVVSTDAEQIIVANQQGQEQGKENKEFTFEYVTGSLEHSFVNLKTTAILYKMGIREHVCDILEGGINAFKKREEKYGL